MNGRAAIAFDVEGLSFTHPGAHQAVLADISFSLQAPRMVALLGSSGAGKSTLLRLLSGLSRAPAGTISFNGAPLRSVRPEIMFLHQDYAETLFPWQTAQRHLAFVLTRTLRDRAAAGAAARAILAEVGLLEHADHYPHQLSGGMQQRLALARALALGSRVLLLDEPLSSVDAATGSRLLQTLRRHCYEHPNGPGIVLFSTHNIAQAMLSADDVAILARQPARLHWFTPRPAADSSGANPFSTDRIFQDQCLEILRMLDT